MNAQERFDNLPKNFESVTVESIVKYWLKGQLAVANHPITPMNPDEYFMVHEVKVEDGKIFVRGENTMWFGENMIKIEIAGM